MARKAMILKQKEEPKFSTRYYNRCKICGRPHAYLRDSASVSWPIRARSPVSERHLGKSFSAMWRYLWLGVHKVRLRRKTLPGEKIFTNLPSESLESS